MPILVVGSLRSVRSDVRRLRASHVLSLLDPGTPPPPLRLQPERHCVLNILDVEDADMSAGPFPDEAFVSAVIDFARSVPEDGRVVVHCHAGRSRSPAVALVMLSEWGVEPVLPGIVALPNGRILAIAETMTGKPLVEAGLKVRRAAALSMLREEDRYGRPAP